jgi:hypothetical protein
MPLFVRLCNGCILTNRSLAVSETAAACCVHSALAAGSSFCIPAASNCALCCNKTSVCCGNLSVARLERGRFCWQPCLRSDVLHCPAVVLLAAMSVHDHACENCDHKEASVLCYDCVRGALNVPRVGSEGVRPVCRKCGSATRMAAMSRSISLGENRRLLLTE